MEFEWDLAKARSNLAKHRISFERAKQVWDDPYHVLRLDRFEGNEYRWHAIGLVDAAVVLLVVHTYPREGSQEHVRIVSARKASPAERQIYDRQII